MGIWDKVKAFFKKKPQNPEIKESRTADKSKVASKGYGSSPLGKALNFAEAKLDAKQNSISKAELAVFKSKIAACAENIGKDEESSLVKVSQIIGGINRA